MTLMKRITSSGLIWLWATALILLVDRFSKTWMLQHLNYQEPVQVLSFFNLALSYNKGAAFSFLHAASGWQNWFLGGLAVLVSVMILIWLAKLSSRMVWVSIALSLILGGALGNVWDRILYGYVIDFLSFHYHDWYFAIFNIADSAICVGAFMLAIFWMRSDS